MSCSGSLITLAIGVLLSVSRHWPRHKAFEKVQVSAVTIGTGLKASCADSQHKTPHSSRKWTMTGCNTTVSILNPPPLPKKTPKGWR